MKYPNEASVGWALAQVARLHRFHLNEQLADMGLFAGQEQLLQALVQNGSLTMSELAKRLRVRVPTASKIVDRLAALDLVERLPEPDDGRVVRVRLTKKGKSLAARIGEIWDSVEGDLLRGMDEKAQKRLRKLLLRAARNLVTAIGGDEHDFEVPLDALDDHRARQA